MDEQRHTESREDRKGGLEVTFADMFEFVDARRRQKALEAEDTSRDERFERRGVPGDDAAPEPDVDSAAPSRGLQFGIQPADVDS